MKYDFTTVYDRRGMDALAVDALGQPGGFAPGKPKDGFSVIPMWVADMNFATVPTIPAAIIERAQHPLYGYFAAPDAYHQAITASSTAPCTGTKTVCGGWILTTWTAC